MSDDRTRDLTEDALWHALRQLLRMSISDDERRDVMIEAVRAGLHETIDRERHPDNVQAVPAIDPAAERTLAALAPDPPFSLSRIYRRTALNQLMGELEHWPAEQHGALIREFHDDLRRR